MTGAGKPLIQAQNYYIIATSDVSAERMLTLKREDVFGVFDRFGDIDAGERGESGIFYEGTRFLSRSRLLFAGVRPLLLSSTVRRDNVILSVDLTNPDLYGEESLLVPRGSLHIYRSQFLWGDTLYQRVRVRNFALIPIDVSLSIDFSADYADVFEVRGTTRERRGRLLPPQAEGESVRLEYVGLDQVARRTIVRCNSNPECLTVEGLCFHETLEPRADRSVELTFAFEKGARHTVTTRYDSGLAKAAAAHEGHGQECAIWTSNEQFNAWLHCSRSDLWMLTTQTPEGAYPYAGVPWFATPFGRDGIITALECLWMNPELARGVLSYLTKTQAKVASPEQDAEPGRILHEAREGEMAVLGEIPFGRYYGSVDATPLYLLLASEYFKRTRDAGFLESIWDGVTSALKWVDGAGDADHDGFVEYSRQSASGLVQQGWKDSSDSVFHGDGRLAEAPIALCEVQAYVFAAKLGLAEVAFELGKEAEAKRLSEEAKQLQRRFEEAFWSPALGTYAIALDGDKKRCEVRTSNAGHCLYSGICSKTRARSVVESFLSDRFYSGWGIRTVAEGEARYNPMAYHNGSIWPHDNALISAGLSRYGYMELSADIMAGLFEAASSLELSRLPELFCGFRRRKGKGPTWYPTACSPQAWSAASAFLMLQSSLGLSVEAAPRRVVLRRPVLPAFLDQVRVRNLAVDGAIVDLRLFRSGESVAVTVDRRVGDVDVMVVR